MGKAITEHMTSKYLKGLLSSERFKKEVYRAGSGAQKTGSIAGFSILKRAGRDELYYTDIAIATRKTTLPDLEDALDDALNRAARDYVTDTLRLTPYELIRLHFLPIDAPLYPSKMELFDYLSLQGLSSAEKEIPAHLAIARHETSVHDFLARLPPKGIDIILIQRKQKYPIEQWKKIDIEFRDAYLDHHLNGVLSGRYTSLKPRELRRTAKQYGLMGEEHQKLVRINYYHKGQAEDIAAGLRDSGYFNALNISLRRDEIEADCTESKDFSRAVAVKRKDVSYKY